MRIRAWKTKGLRVFSQSILVVGVLAAVGCVGLETPAADPAEESARKADRAEAATAPRLVSLVDDGRQATLRPEDYQDPAFKEVVSLITPEGYRINYRFRELGVPVAQALSLSKDPQVHQRLLEVARFQTGEKSRAESLLVLATEKNPAHYKFFKEAVLDRNVSIQFAGIEALEAWALPEAVPLLLNAAEQNWSSLIRVFAAQAAWRLGAREAKDKLVRYLNNPNWLMRAMAARYIGDMGGPEDLDAILSRIDRENDNDFVLAELCVSGLKLAAKKSPTPPPPTPPTPTRRANARVSDLFELEPLVVTAPRARAGRQFVDPRIDIRLVNLLEKIAVAFPEVLVIDDPVLQDVFRLKTPKGFALGVRYTDIRYLLTEGLAGTSNLTLVSRLENIFKATPDGGVRAAALVALGWDPTRVDLSPFRAGLTDAQTRVRFGAVEGLAAQANPIVNGILADAAQSDASPIVRLYAAQALGRRGDWQGVNIIRRHLSDASWVVRSLAIYYLGQLGDESDFERLLVNLDRETENQVTAENCLAVLRMAR